MVRSPLNDKCPCMHPLCLGLTRRSCGCVCIDDDDFSSGNQPELGLAASCLNRASHSPYCRRRDERAPSSQLNAYSPRLSSSISTLSLLLRTIRIIIVSKSTASSSKFITLPDTIQLESHFLFWTAGQITARTPILGCHTDPCFSLADPALNPVVLGRIARIPSSIAKSFASFAWRLHRWRMPSKAGHAHHTHLSDSQYVSVRILTSMCNSVCSFVPHKYRSVSSITRHTYIPSPHS